MSLGEVGLIALNRQYNNYVKEAKDEVKVKVKRITSFKTVNLYIIEIHKGDI